LVQTQLRRISKVANLFCSRLGKNLFLLGAVSHVTQIEKNVTHTKEMLHFQKPQSKDAGA